MNDPLARIHVKRYDAKQTGRYSRENNFDDAGDVVHVDMGASDTQLTVRLDRTGALSVHIFIQGIEVSTFRRYDRLRLNVPNADESGTKVEKEPPVNEGQPDPFQRWNPDDALPPHS